MDSQNNFAKFVSFVFLNLGGRPKSREHTMEKRLTISKVFQVESLSQIWLSVSEASLSYNEQGL